jgi:hypothetical protein
MLKFVDWGGHGEFVTVSTSYKESPLDLGSLGEISRLQLSNHAGMRGVGGTIVNIGILVVTQGRAPDFLSGRSWGVVGSQGSGVG